MRFRYLTLLSAILILSACTFEEGERPGDDPEVRRKPIISSFYSVSEYDPERDPSEDLANVVKQAQDTNKRILLEVGGEWCGWCHILDNYIQENEVVAEALQKNFFIIKVN